MNLELLIGNDQTVELQALKDEVSGDFINNATVTARLKTMAGVDVAGETWPITLAYVTNTDGNYRGLLEDGLTLSNLTRYIVEIRADAGADLIGFWRFTVTARYRTPDNC